MGKLSVSEQVELVCEAPLARRAELLDLTPLPEVVIPELPEAELVFTVKSIGLSDSAWILEYATPEQFVACVDLDVWRGTTPDRKTLSSWIDAFAEIGPVGFLRAIRSLDPEIVAASEAEIGDDDIVMGVVINGQARAYPVNYMNGPNNEVVNDELGGELIAPSW